MELVVNIFLTKLETIESVSKIERLCHMDTSLRGLVLCFYHSVMVIELYDMCLVIVTD